ncbi:hypothetical protein ACFL11_00720 [Patescibacteria group bacterium]
MHSDNKKGRRRRDMGSKIDLLMGTDAFTLLGLLRKAAACKGLEIDDSSSSAYSKPIKEYPLDKRLLAILAEQGIKRQARPGDTFTLIDENPQERNPAWATSKHWNFKPLKDGRHGFDLRIFLKVGFSLNGRYGFVLWPRAHGPFISPDDRLPNFRMFKELAENDVDAPDIAKELAASKGSVAITWTELGLGGIRTLVALFTEFARRNKAVMQLGRGRRVFDPNPYPLHQQPGDQLFIVEPAQQKVIQTWRAQLSKYRASLAA